MKNISRTNSYLALVSGIQKCNDTSNWALETESLIVFIILTKKLPVGGSFVSNLCAFFSMCAT